MENYDLLMSCSPSEMLDLWKTVMRLTPVRRECTIERDDGIDLDALLTLHIRQWYAHLLATAPPLWLPVDDLKDHITLTARAGGVVEAALPPRCVRPVEWRLSNWSHSVSHFLDPASPQAQAQYSEWTRGGSQQPAIVDHGRHLTLYSGLAGTTPQLEMARCVTRPEQGAYVFHQAALSTIPAWEQNGPQLL